MDTNVIALWPDNTWCLLEEINNFLLWMSDDYQLVLCEVDNRGEPIIDWTLNDFPLL